MKKKVTLLLIMAAVMTFLFGISANAAVLVRFHDKKTDQSEDIYLSTKLIDNTSVKCTNEFTGKTETYTLILVPPETKVYSSGDYDLTYYRYYSGKWLNKNGYSGYKNKVYYWTGKNSGGGGSKITLPKESLKTGTNGIYDYITCVTFSPPESSGLKDMKLCFANIDEDSYKDYLKKQKSSQPGKQTVTAQAGSSSIAVGETTKITASGKGTITYSSSDKSVATVNKNGKVTAKSVGTVKITVKASGNSNYEAASTTVTIKVNPKPATLKSVKNTASKQMTVKWKKRSGVTGYQIQYSTDKNFKSAKTNVTVSGASKTSRVIKKLKKGKTYYVRIRTYQNIGSTTYLSTWSASKKVKMTK